jgi:ParB-like chromosome segregation protein Spo0J
VQIERRPLTDVTPPSWNARTGHNVDGIAESITTHGMLDPIGVWAFQDGEPLEPPHLIVEGSGRFYAVKQLGDAEIPTIAHDFPDEAAAQAYAINHNLQTDESEFDDARLEATLTGLEARERLHEAGFDGSALAELRARIDAGDLARVEFPEYDEDIADDVEYIECPECHHKWPK